MAHSDGLPSDRGLRGYRHDAVNHSAGEYVRGDVHVNSIEGFWARLKLSIRGLMFTCPAVTVGSM